MRIRVTDACAGCGHCTAVCTSNVRVHEEVRDYGMVVDSGCMKCLDCVSVCPNDALYYGAGRCRCRQAARRRPEDEALPASLGRGRRSLAARLRRRLLHLPRPLRAGAVPHGAGAGRGPGVPGAAHLSARDAAQLAAQGLAAPNAAASCSPRPACCWRAWHCCWRFWVHSAAGALSDLPTATPATARPEAWADDDARRLGAASAARRRAIGARSNAAIRPSRASSVSG